MINIKDPHLNIVKNVLQKYDFSFYVFGSRITDKAKEFSDLDLLYFDEIPDAVLINIINDFEESDLPYEVDLLDYNKFDDDFKKIIGKNYICIQKK